MQKKQNLNLGKLFLENSNFQKLLLGHYYGVFIDDTGSPGMPNTPAGLHPDRKSWVAVVIPPKQVSPIAINLNEAIDALGSDLGLEEYHFVDIYSGKGPFREVSMDKRMQIFKMFAALFYIHEPAIYVQTFDPVVHGQLAAATLPPKLPKVADCFDMHSYKDAALWLLLVRVRDHLMEKRSSKNHRAMVVIDEGLKKAGSCVEVDVLDDVFLDGRLHFEKSFLSPMLQLADFAAFCLNRSQNIIRKDNRSDLDFSFLRILEPLGPLFKNCIRNGIWPENEGPMFQ